MKLKNILKQHLEPISENALKTNLGDSFLLKNNQIYKEIRQAALKADFSFTDNVDSSYTSLPLSQLDLILKRKTIPFHNNVDVLFDIEAKSPGQIEWDFICDGLKQNHIFHESCHAVARTLSSDFTFGSGKELLLVIALMEESFANTCELLAVQDTTDAIHKIFYEWNSYICIFQEKTNLKKALVEIGRSQVFKFFILSYLYCNFLHERWEDSDFQRVLKLCFGAKVSEQTKKILRALSKEVFTLNPRFRYATTSFYLRTNGYNETIENALSFDPLALIEKNEDLKKWLERLSTFEKPI